MRAIKRFFRWVWNFFALVGIGYTLIPVLILWALFHIGESERHGGGSHKKESKNPYSVWVFLNAPIIEEESPLKDFVVHQIFGQDDGIYLPSVRSALRQAATDAQVKDIQLVVDGLSGGASDMEELRAILLEFKASGKPVVSYVSHMDDSALLISSVADKIHLNPVSDVSLPGPTFAMTYFGDAIRRLGVDIQVVRSGKYKSAFEPLIANEPSAESRESLGQVERSMRDHLVKQVAQSRKKQDSEVFLWFKESIFTPAKAKELGIVDELAYVPYVDFDHSEDMTLEEYAADPSFAAGLTKGYSLRPDDGIGFIEAVGQITDGESDETSISPDSLNEEIQWAMDNEDVKAVVLRISSPGGSAAASDLLWNRVRQLDEKKPVIVSMGSVAASGGYYIASGGRKIFANPSTITGSIGVIGMIPAFDGMKDKWGVTFHSISQSNRANVLSGRKMTAQDQSYLQATLEDVYRTFKSRVAANRNMSMEKVEQLAQGRVYSGIQAKELGLVDELGGLQDAFQFAKKAAGFDENKLYPVHRYEPAQMSLSACLANMSKLRRCLKRHGGSLKLGLETMLLGDAAIELRQIKAAREMMDRPKAMTYHAGSARL
jgi:protease-4